jgi:hypothetical protein
LAARSTAGHVTSLGYNVAELRAEIRRYIDAHNLAGAKPQMGH